MNNYVTKPFLLLKGTGKCRETLFYSAISRVISLSSGCNMLIAVNLFIHCQLTTCHPTLSHGTQT